MTSFIALVGHRAGSAISADNGGALGWWRRVGAALPRLGAAARAHDRRLASEALGADTMRDTGVAPEMATGVQRWQAELPFFMQSDFGK